MKNLKFLACLLLVLSLSTPLPSWAKKTHIKRVKVGYEKLPDQQLLVAFKGQSNDFNNPDERGQAHTEILLRGKDPVIVGGLIELCEKGSPLEKIHAAKILGELYASEAIPTLSGLLENQKNFTLYYAALSSLTRIGGPSVAQTIVHAYETTKDNSQKTCAIIYLGDLKQTQMIPAFKKDFDSNDRMLKSASGLALAKLGDPSALQWARDQVKEDKADPLYAINGIMILGEIGTLKEDLPILERAEKKPEMLKKYGKSLMAAKFELQTRDLPEADKVSQLSDLVDLDLTGMSLWAVKWLDKNGSPEALAKLDELLNDPKFVKFQPDILNELRQKGQIYKRSTNKDGSFNFQSTTPPDSETTDKPAPTAPTITGPSKTSVPSPHP